jgi:hypothetical protein
MESKNRGRQRIFPKISYHKHTIAHIYTQRNPAESIRDQQKANDCGEAANFNLFIGSRDRGCYENAACIRIKMLMRRRPH